MEGSLLRGRSKVDCLDRTLQKCNWQNLRGKIKLVKTPRTFSGHYSPTLFCTDSRHPKPALPEVRLHLSMDILHDTREDGSQRGTTLLPETVLSGGGGREGGKWEMTRPMLFVSWNRTRSLRQLGCAQLFYFLHKKAPLSLRLSTECCENRRGLFKLSRQHPKYSDGEGRIIMTSLYLAPTTCGLLFQGLHVCLFDHYNSSMH